MRYPPVPTTPKPHPAVIAKAITEVHGEVAQVTSGSLAPKHTKRVPQQTKTNHVLSLKSRKPTLGRVLLTGTLHQDLPRDPQDTQLSITNPNLHQSRKNPVAYGPNPPPLYPTHLPRQLKPFPLLKTLAPQIHLPLLLIY